MTLEGAGVRACPLFSFGSPATRLLQPATCSPATYVRPPVSCGTVRAMKPLTRRHALALLGTSAVAAWTTRLHAASAARPMRGAFMILNTPFTSTGEVDWEDLAGEALFVDRCGCQGIVWPQGSSGVATLTREERLRGMDLLAKAMQGKRAALVLGVPGKDTAEMLRGIFKTTVRRTAAPVSGAMPPLRTFTPTPVGFTNAFRPGSAPLKECRSCPAVVH